MAGYIRQSTFVDGDTITAALFNNEYNQLVNAFSNTSGHKHDGTTAEGPVIGLIGDAGETSPNNKVLIDTTNNYIEFYVEVSSNPVQQIYIADGAIIPVTDNDIDLGTSSLEFKNIYIDGTATIDTLTVDEAATVGTTLGVTGATTLSSTLGVTGATTLSSTLAVTGATTLSSTLAVTGTSTLTGNVTATNDLSVGGNLTVTGNATISGNLTFGDADTDSINLSAEIDSNIVPNTDDTYDLGTTTKQWRNLYIDGTAEIDTLAIDGTTVTSTAAELNILDGVTSTAAELNILDGVTSTTAELNILDGVTSTATELNIVDGDTAATSTTLADADRVVVNDAGTMKQVALTDFETYFEGALDTLSNVTTVGALNAGSITSGFGAIDNGSSAITTTGTVTYGNLSDGTITITAFVDEDDMSSDSATLVPTQQSVKAYVDTTVAATNEVVEDTTPQLGGTLDTNGNLIQFGDSSSATDDRLQFGASQDLEIYHDGSNSIIADSGTGSLLLRGSNVWIQNADGTETGARFITDGAIDLRYDNSIKLATTSTGIDVTGTVTATDLLIDTDVIVTDSTNDRVGINKTSPATTLDVGGSIYFSSILRATGDGSAAAPSIQPGNDGDTGLFRPTANTIGFSTGGSERMRIDSSGNVGIGTTSPSALLHVASTGASNIKLEDTDNGFAATELNVENGGRDLKITTPQDTIFVQGSSESMRIIDGGNVGIGTSSPSSYNTKADDLVVATSSDTGISIISGTSSEGALAFGDGTSGSSPIMGRVRYNHSSNEMDFRVNNEQVMTIDSSGNVGIGTSSPVTTAGYTSLTINNATNGGQLALQSNGTTAWSMSVDGSSVYLDSPTTRPIRLFANGSERMRIASNGSIGINQSSPSSTYVLDVAGAVRSTGNAPSFNLREDDSSSQHWQLGSYSGVYAIRDVTAGTFPFNINSSGNVGIGTSSPSATLDIESSLPIIHLEDNVGSTARIYNDNGVLGFDADYNQGVVGSAMTFSVDASEAMRIDSSGNVGIGCTPTGFATEIQATTGGNGLKIRGRSAGGNEGWLAWTDNADNVEAAMYATADNLIFANTTSYTERMRIDSSGNLLVGTTNANIYNTTGDDGVAIKTDNIQVQRANNEPLFLNRTGSDGIIASFRKDGSAVGSLASISSAYLAVRSNGGNLRLGANNTDYWSIDEYRIYPTTDAVDDIGLASNRVRNLHLSGGVYLGGSGAANYLDDYEEGTWTVGFNGATVTANNTTGYYTKIGNVVYFGYYSESSTIASTSGSAIITGLPFTVSSTYLPLYTAHNTFFGGSTTNGVEGYPALGDTTLRFTIRGNTSAASYVNGSGKYIMVAGFYYTTA